jgi:hypothetical protein
MYRNRIPGFLAIMVAACCPWLGYSLMAAVPQGGEDWTDAFEITSLPFSDDGTTIDYNPDWVQEGDPWCPIPANGPDVFYSYRPSHDMYVNIDLCGSDFDNMLAVIDQDFNEIDCRDEDWSYMYWVNDRPCGENTARLSRVPLQADLTYFIIITSLGDDGNYEIYMHEDVVVPVECPPEAIDEGEPPIVDGYWDEFNSGCTGMSPDNPFLFVDLEDQATVRICANSGWWSPVNADTDWYRLELGAQGELEAILESERSTFLMHLNPPDCDTYGIEQWCLAGYGETGSLVVSGSPGQIVWLVVAPRSLSSDFWPEIAEYTYLLTINSGGVANEETTWSEMKSLYR